MTSMLWTAAADEYGSQQKNLQEATSPPRVQCSRRRWLESVQYVSISEIMHLFYPLAITSFGAASEELERVCYAVF